MSSSLLWSQAIFNALLSSATSDAMLYDMRLATAQAPRDDHVHKHEHNASGHHDHPSQQRQSDSGKHSAITRFILDRCKKDGLIYGILQEKDSRRIAYFTLLNFTFMFIQGVYGYLSGSLGLLSDTVHMFFDCLGLIVGLGAAVASKFPPTPEYPYGWGKLNTLAGFGNGIFLMLDSVEFVWEAIEGIVEARELRHVKELLVVSTLGFLVNMVGLFAFGHAHHGHDHGHSHDHSYSHNHSHSHNEHSHTNSDNGAKHSHASHAHSHSHNENMHGIFLHVAADAGGSLAVILSTALTLWKPWYGWDPLATIVIAILIFAAAVPLVTASGQKLLLVVPSEMEYAIKGCLQGVSEMRGVVDVGVCRIWDKESGTTDQHEHDHHHAHDHHAHDDHSHHSDHSHHDQAHSQHFHNHHVDNRIVSNHKTCDHHAHNHDHDHSSNHISAHYDDNPHSAHNHAYEHHQHIHDHGHHPAQNADYPASNKALFTGVLHVLAAAAADIEDIRFRVTQFTSEKGMDLVVQVERERDSPMSARAASMFGSKRLETDGTMLNGSNVYGNPGSRNASPERPMKTPW